MEGLKRLTQHPAPIKPLLDAHYREFDSRDQQIPVPTNSAAHTLNHPHTAYPSTIGLDLTQPIRAVSPLIVNPTAQKTGTIDITTSSKENDGTPDMELPPAEITPRLKNCTPIGDPPTLPTLQHTGKTQGNICVL